MSDPQTGAGQRAKAWMTANVHEYPLADPHSIDFDSLVRTVFDRDDRPDSPEPQHSIEIELAKAMAKEFRGVLPRQTDQQWIKTARGADDAT